jgi:hypothetical protein
VAHIEDLAAARQAIGEVDVEGLHHEAALHLGVGRERAFHREPPFHHEAHEIAVDEARFGQVDVDLPRDLARRVERHLAAGR